MVNPKRPPAAVANVSIARQRRGRGAGPPPGRRRGPAGCARGRSAAGRASPRPAGRGPSGPARRRRCSGRRAARPAGRAARPAGAATAPRRAAGSGRAGRAGAGPGRSAPRRPPPAARRWRSRSRRRRRRRGPGAPRSVAVASMIALTCGAGRSGRRSRTRAARPATSGEAIDVPREDRVAGARVAGNPGVPGREDPRSRGGGVNVGAVGREALDVAVESVAPTASTPSKAAG